MSRVSAASPFVPASAQDTEAQINTAVAAINTVAAKLDGTINVEQQGPMGYDFVFQSNVAGSDLLVSAANVGAAVSLTAMFPAVSIKTMEIVLRARQSGAGTATFIVRQTFDQGASWYDVPFIKADGTTAKSIAITPTTGNYLTAEAEKIHVVATGGLIAVFVYRTTADVYVAARGLWMPGA